MNEVTTLERLFRNSIGFDTLTSQFNKSSGFPPYDVIKNDDNRYTLQLALAGYDPEDVTVVQEDRKLTVSCESAKQQPTNNKTEYLHRGIAKRNFSTTLVLGDHVEVDKAKFHNGLLIIDLNRVVPERLQRKTIPISTK